MRLRELFKRFSGRRAVDDQVDKNFLSPNTTIIPYTSLFTEGVSDSDANRYRSRLWDPASPTPHPGLDVYRCYYSDSQDAQLARLDVTARRLSLGERWRTRRIRQCRRRKAKAVSETVIDVSEELTHWQRRLQEMIDSGWAMDSSRVDRALNELRQRSLLVRDRNKSRSKRLRNPISFYAEAVPQPKLKSPFEDPLCDNAREEKLQEICDQNTRFASSVVGTDPFRSDISTSRIAPLDIQEESSRITRKADVPQERHEVTDNTTMRASFTDFRMTNRRHEIYFGDPDMVTVNNIYDIIDEFTGPTNSDDENEASWQFRNESAHARGSSCEYCAALRMKVRCITEWTVKAERYIATFTDTYPRASDSDLAKAGVVRAAIEVMSAFRRHKENARMEQEIRLWNGQRHERSGGFHFELPGTSPQSYNAGPIYRFR
ncbi:uncharacterized protein V1513DRAFT_277959 [Lipomyces chichibuensis]|uniref:uncharacterized protein n=1 Tax=Lipomyces chichibuensis TaxID=1546026 RepID=UPI0033436DEE